VPHLKVTVVVVHRNRPERLRATVDALRGQTVPTRVLLVDAGSEAAHRDAAEAIIGEDADDEFVAFDANLGFGPGGNVGLRRWLDAGTGEWVGLCPHDALPAPDCIETMLEALDPRPRAGLASADVGDGLSAVVDRYFGPLFRPAAVTEGWEPVDYPHGTLLLARRGCLEDVGVFDERYFSYCEEADLGLRARARRWEIGLVRGARVTNPDLSSSVALVDYLQLRNTLLLTRDHFGRYATFIRFTTALLQLASQTLLPSRRPLVFDARARVRALRDHLRGCYGPPPGDL
jgi:GT2 family glycosyltransferase